MPHRIRNSLCGTAFLFVVLSTSAGCAGDGEAVPGRSSGETSATERLGRLFDEVWQASLERSAYLRMREGVPIERLDDLSYESHAADVARAQRWLEELAEIEPALAEHADRIDAAALRWDLETAVAGDRWFWHQSVLTPYSTPVPMIAEVLRGRPLGDDAQRRQFLQLLSGLPEFFAQLEQRVRGQAERGIHVWRPNHETALALLRSFLSGDGSGGPFALSEARLESVPEDGRQDLAERVRGVLRDEVDPAIESLIAFLDSEPYRQATPEGVGADELPDGEAWYRYRVRAMTTVDTTPEAVHERGLALVAEMEAAMLELQGQTGFEGSAQAFRDELRTDPAYFPKSSDEVAERLMAAAEDMEEVVDRYFVTRPRAEYGVRGLLPALRGSQTYRIYRPATPGDPVGRYRYSGSRLDERSWLNLRGVSLHELVPGHHFHIARQSENQDLPDYRRNSWHTAYTEGWGSYSSYLGLEAGIYDGDPLSAYGMYSLEVFLATRLVVDTGMNALGWTLEQGREFMRQHTLESPTQIATESLRYAADMPGQALAYQMGKLAILDLRRHAEEQLGDRFDLRAFHEALLEHGSLPMEVLRSHVDWWIEQQRQE